MSLYFSVERTHKNAHRKLICIIYSIIASRRTCHRFQTFKTLNNSIQRTALHFLSLPRTIHSIEKIKLSNRKSTKNQSGKSSHYHVSILNVPRNQHEITENSKSTNLRSLRSSVKHWLFRFNCSRARRSVCSMLQRYTNVCSGIKEKEGDSRIEKQTRYSDTRATFNIFNTEKSVGCSFASFGTCVRFGVEKSLQTSEWYTAFLVVDCSTTKRTRRRQRNQFKCTDNDRSIGIFTSAAHCPIDDYVKSLELRPKSRYVDDRQAHRASHHPAFFSLFLCSHFDNIEPCCGFSAAFALWAHALVAKASSTTSCSGEFDWSDFIFMTSSLFAWWPAQTHTRASSKGFAFSVIKKKSARHQLTSFSFHADLLIIFALREIVITPKPHWCSLLRVYCIFFLVFSSAILRRLRRICVRFFSIIKKWILHKWIL